jgi:hypothetical protein
LAELGTIIASGIALYLFLAKRSAVASVFKLLLGYANQLTLSELKSKLDRLNDLNADEEGQSRKVIIILHEIIGHIRGSRLLKRKCADILVKAEKLARRSRPIDEARKRAFVSELRGALSDVSIDNIDDLTGGEHD